MKEKNKEEQVEHLIYLLKNFANAEYNPDKELSQEEQAKLLDLIQMEIDETKEIIIYGKN